MIHYRCHHNAFLMLATACYATGSDCFSRSDILSGSGNACPDGYAALGSFAACHAAMDLFRITGEDYNGDGIEDHWPKGCYVCSNVPECDDGVWFWFNNHATGAAVTLCAIAGWETALTRVLFVSDSDMDYWDTSPLLLLGSPSEIQEFSLS